MEALIRNNTVFFAVVLIAVLWGVLWMVVITIWPQGPFSARRHRRRPRPDFNSTALEGLQNLTLVMQSGLQHNGRAHNTEILLKFCWQLNHIGRLLTDSGRLQIERFCGRALRQIATDAQTGSSHAAHLRRMLEWLEALIAAIESQSVSGCFRALAALFYLANGGYLENSPPDLPTDPELYPHFSRSFSQVFADPDDLAAFTEFLSDWQDLTLKKDAYLFFLLRVLDAFRKPLYLLQYQTSPHLESRERVTRWANDYLEALRKQDWLKAYVALSYLVTEVQLLREGETPSTYVVNLERLRRPRVLATAQPSPVTLREPRLTPAYVPANAR